uniref:Ig-like domain-containing protein n=1 Tax=Oryzias melastigma TaxID=30732 RepID=A0A3B3DSF9_ORYME
MNGANIGQKYVRQMKQYGDSLLLNLTLESTGVKGDQERTHILPQSGVKLICCQLHVSHVLYIYIYIIIIFVQILNKNTRKNNFNLFFLTPSGKPKVQLKGLKVIPVGGRVNLTCSVNSSSPGWIYEWFQGGKPIKQKTAQDAVFLSNGQISVSQEGVYRCRGGRGEPVYHSEFSDFAGIKKYGGFNDLFFDIKILKSYLILVYTENKHISPTEPEPVLRVSPRWLSPGSSVTLSCEVEHESAGWSFYWYKAVPDLSHKSGSYSYELLPASSNGTADNSYIIHGQTHTAGYVCRAGRGEPHVYTLYSQPHFVWSGDLHPSASLSVSPDRVQHFTSDSVSLTCEGNSAEWRVGSFLLPDLLSFCSDWGTMNGSTCHVQKIQSSNAVFWCESGSAFSNAVNITGHSEWKHVWIPVFSLTFIIGLIRNTCRT